MDRPRQAIGFGRDRDRMLDRGDVDLLQNVERALGGGARKFGQALRLRVARFGRKAAQAELGRESEEFPGALI